MTEHSKNGKAIGTCLCCDNENLQTILNLGEQPPSNIFLYDKYEPYNSHELHLTHCATCGLLQLYKPMPFSTVSCRHDWLVYNEPESHLDDLVEKILPLLSSTDCYMAGMSYKDLTLLNRFTKYGFKNTEVIDTRLMSLPADERGIEKIQHYVDNAFVNNYIQHKPLADILFVRQILEHSYNPKLFMDICSRIVKEDGLIVFEIPGNDKIFASAEHCYLWEEHITYFTRNTIKYFMNTLSYEIIDMYEYDYTMENSIIIILKNRKMMKNVHKQYYDKEIVNNFSCNYNKNKLFLHEKLSKICRHQKIPLFGAGHLGLKFINFYGLKNYISSIIDDNTHKKGLFMPACGIEILNSDFFKNNKPSVCLMSLNPESEAKFLESKKQYILDGWEFLSIFSRSDNSIFT